MAIRMLLVALASTMLSFAFDARAARTVEVTDFGSNPGNLRMYEYVPENVRSSPALVVALHGCTQTARDYDREPGWSGLADKWGFVLVLPEQVSSNNANLCFNFFNGEELVAFQGGNDQERDQGEALSIREMIEKASRDHHVDRNRIYVTGLSGGGAMSAVMLATYPDLFAGGAIIAGVPYKCATRWTEAVLKCGIDLGDAGHFPTKNLTAPQWGKRVRGAFKDATSWPPVSIWQGTSDVTVNPQNSWELVQQWTNVHRVSSVPTTDKVKGFTHEMYKNASGKIVVERYLIAGMGHATPVDPLGETQCGVAGKYASDKKICSSYYIGKFWGLDKAP